ncbi:hypothetical protein CKF54_04275 [Psittacicella hinzii]|uniref:J domain-containing protein n=1 Tax=Psittacicella hinzii TaxID=2028575 RepID=A0A3A1Y9E3_9GAMM|nr:DnaJ domain-containing protein [Psittacicella hinzii]RIY32754.1 hypothetical protein CKF54_04275 [Psittacicella hinzii]
MQKNFPWTIVVCGFVGLMIFGVFGLVIGILLGVYLEKKQRDNSAQNIEIYQRQVDNLAEIIGCLLRKTGNATRSAVNDAKTLFGEEISNSYPYVDIVRALERLDTAANDSSVDENISIGHLRNTMMMTQSRSGVYFLTVIIYVYCNAVRTRGDDRLYSAIFTIGSALNIPPQITAVLLMRATDYGRNQSSSQDSWRDAFTGGGYQDNSGYERQQQNSYQNYYRADAQKELQAAYDLLGVSSNVTKEELRKAKRRLQAKWHPDKAPEGKKEEYNEMSQKINAAADLISAFKGF